MRVDNSNAAATGNTLTQSTSQALGKEDFLKLLVAQLAHQDPLKPQEGAEFVAELAQFSNLEQLMGANDKLGQLGALSDLGSDSQAMTLVGKTVTYDTSAVTLGQIGSTPLKFELPAASRETKIEIFASDGTVLRTIDAGALGQGTQTINFDGNSDDGQRLKAGEYGMRIKAKDQNGGIISVKTEHKGKVSAVVRENGRTELEIGGSKVSLNNISRVE